jgi:signal peptidase I
VWVALLVLPALGCGGQSWNTGDRVLVAKFLYDTGLRLPERHDVVVFKFPERPQENHVPMNYIKRLIGKGGETIGIYYGNLYVATDLDYSGQEKPDKPEDAWKPPYMYENLARDRLKRDAVARLDVERKFQIIRKPPDKVLALRRLVYDNDHQAKDLVGVLPPRWAPEGADGSWKADDPQRPRSFRHTGRPGAGLAWLRYRHIVSPFPRPLAPEPDRKPELITDFMGYNTGESDTHSTPLPNWVGDLLLEGEVTIEQAEGELVFELAKGVDRFQARWQLGSGTCTLVRLGENDRATILASKMTALAKAKTYQVRFANVDERLTVWVDGQLPFGDGVVYDPAREPGPTAKDLRPASIGLEGGSATVRKLRLWRDTYYTVNIRPPDADGRTEDWGDPSKWQYLQELPAKTLYVQPGHYLCLGDNSPESSDSRSWGLVPERLMLGRALLVYFPFSRLGPIK